MLALVVLPLNAQLSKGNWMAAGSSAVDFTAETDKYKSDGGDGTNGRALSLTFTPQVGYFVINNLAAGLMLELDYSSYKQDGAEHRSSDVYLLPAPFARYYFGSTKILPFAEAAVGFGPSFSKYDNYLNETVKEHGQIFAFQMKGGVSVFLNDKVSVDMGMGYRYVSTKSTDNNPSNYRDIATSFILQFGVTVIL